MHNKYDIFDKWAQKSIHYHAEDNRYYYDRIKIHIDINYLINVLKHNKIDIKYIERVKKVVHITTDISGIKKVEYINKFVYNSENDSETLNYELFDKHDTLIVQSCTGTGKLQQSPNISLD
jgi:hypothetical protein